MRVVITRPRAQAGDFARALAALGAEAIFFPTIEISPVENPAPLDGALHRLGDFAWVIFTSANAVQAVWERLAARGVALPAGLRVAAVGPKTAAALAARGIVPDFVPDEYLAEAVLPGLGEVRGQCILLPLADMAPSALPRALAAAGSCPHRVTAYHTLPAQPDPDGIAALRAGVDVLTFTSGSTVRNFIALVRAAGLDPFNLPKHPQIACIGPKTANAAREAGFEVLLTAQDYTVEGLLSTLTSSRPI